MTFLSAYAFMCYHKGRTKGRASRAVGRGASLQVALRREWNNRKYGASKIRFPHAEEALRQLSEICARALKERFDIPELCRQNLKNICFKGRQIISPAGEPICLGPALVFTE
jgi:hypothetical protein